ncbi:hypothetical protein R4Z10_18030 [Niallia sp. XMNu-256]
MKRGLKRKLLFIIGIIVLGIAAFLDIQYQGLFFQLLPESVQSLFT